MTRGILIAGNESSLFSAVASEAEKRVKTFCTVLVPNRLSMPEGTVILPLRADNATGAIPLSWNPSSSISARALVLAAENRLEKINDAILVCSPPAVFKTAETLLPEEIETLVNDHIKGWFFLARELALYFRRAGEGALSFIVAEAGPGGVKSTQAELLGPSAASSFRSLTQGILDSSANAPFLATGFTGCEAGTEGEFASWLFKIIDEGARKNSGRWHKHSKLRLFR